MNSLEIKKNIIDSFRCIKCICNKGIDFSCKYHYCGHLHELNYLELLILKKKIYDRIFNIFFYEQNYYIHYIDTIIKRTIRYPIKICYKQFNRDGCKNKYCVFFHFTLEELKIIHKRIMVILKLIEVFQLNTDISSVKTNYSNS